MTTALTLTGLGAQNPLAFFAALGLLRVVDWHAQQKHRTRPRLYFLDDGRQTPTLLTELSFEALVDLLLQDAAEQASNAALQLAYDDAGEIVAASDPEARRDLKPSPKAARQFLEQASQSDRRTADLAAALFSELVQDNNGNSKPTSLHFTAGQQAFLSMVDELRNGLSADGIREALLGPWRNTSQLPSLSWDSSVTRLYALRASNPSKEKRGSVPAANWLGVHALAFFPVHAKPSRFKSSLITTGVRGGWKDSSFTWPTWNVPCSASSAASLLRSDPKKWTSAERAAVGVSAVFSSKILRSDQGGYGSFSPAEVVLPYTRVLTKAR